MSPVPSQPSKLPYSTDIQYYVDYLRNNYGGKKITTPEGYEVRFYLEKDSDCLHVVCGKGKTAVNHARARMIPYIEYVLLDESTRVLRFNKKSRNICFVSRKHSYVIICSVIRNKELKFISQFYDQSKNKTYIDSFDNRSMYREI
jgi:hypothetical protein